MTPTLRDLQDLIETAHARGARAAEVLSVQGTGTRVERRDRRHVLVDPTADERCVVRCWLDEGRVAESAGSHAELSALLDRALAAAADAPPNPFAGPVERLGTPGRGLGIDDRRHEQLTREDRVEVVETNEAAAARADARIRTGLFAYTDRRERRAIANSRGVAMEAWNTRYDATGVVVVRTDDGPIELQEHVAGRAFTATACLPFGANLARRALSLVEPPVPLDGPVRVLLRPRATAHLIAWLADLLVAPTRPPFLDREGQLFHRRLHLVDDGALPGGLNTRGFDDDGVPPVPLALVREGVVEASPLGVAEARRLGARPSGHRVGDALRPTNLQLHAGMRSVNAHLGEQPPGSILELEGLEGLAGAVDPATGALDLVVHGAVWDRQERRGSVRFARLRGNVIEALQAIVGVASDTDRILHVDAPAMFLDGLSAHTR